MIPLVKMLASGWHEHEMTLDTTWLDSIATPSKWGLERWQF